MSDATDRAAAPTSGSADGGAALRYDAAPRRRDAILERLRASGHVSVSEVSQALGVSEMTVRRDLRRLVETGDASLVHGGASLPAGSHGRPVFGVRALVNAEAKRRIGAAAAAMVAADDTVGIDAGTTALEVAHALPETFSGCVVTHSAPALAVMLARKAARVIAIGGELSHDNQAMIGPSAAHFVRNLRLRLLVLGVASIDVRGVYVRSELELSVKQALLDVAEDVVLVCDASKEGGPGTVRVCTLDRIDTVVTDAPMSEGLTRRLHAAGTRIVVAR
ncbi:DeoR/GlpR family DNA-binding transcription regulator [Pseudonocardia sp. MH-G8]|uniref:DeoR/GlpR family DNA-binding transcription regulator n=1 Tax=Pseudonocardia sp. MH-G8 TaxID=1854588 RepID=UPI001304533B|nr:DeoR/GlpR family DNA-binding transcription regulator [Pseudonocardia sp. MH-G8]